MNSFEMTVKELKRYNNKHRANQFLDEYARGRKTLYVWELSNIEREPNPYHYIPSASLWSKVTEREEEPDFQTEENLESLGIPSSAVMDMENSEEENDV